MAKKNGTWGDLYGPAMSVTEPAEAEALVARLTEHVGHSLSSGQEKLPTRAEAERIVRKNIAYYAGYYGDETRRRVERLFRASHPILGAIAAEPQPPTEPSPEAS